MYKISKKTLKDLEFNIIQQQLSEYCFTEIGKQNALKLTPFTAPDLVELELSYTFEYLSSDLQATSIPNHGYDVIDKELKLLEVNNSFLETLGFKKLVALNRTANELLSFFKKQIEFYPNLQDLSSKYTFTTAVIEFVDTVIDRFGEVKSDASTDLAIIRRQINDVQGKLNGSFGRALRGYLSQGFLDEIKETVVDNRRVLAVKSMYRKKVKGAALGSSKSGSIVYIEPEETRILNNSLTDLLYEEKQEVIKILKQLTDRIRPFAPILNEYQEYLSTIDLIAAKVLYGKSYKGVVVKLSKARELTLKEAYHPLLLLSNLEKGAQTFAQDIQLRKEDHRIIVISGPNAGGKSITLKTVGLLQVMFQSGMLVPVHPYSTFCVFTSILTDIGDNQSIENHLSTYSYRLKNMKYFLKTCDDKTLFLIDEFGTGSDPELGGALAESFLEVFYERESFGIITTHYANLKLMANNLPAISNANMLFDTKSLEPKFKLHLGEAGSSFTFEVAQKNGIPYHLINKAKKKVARGKIRFDKSIANLQKERSKLEKVRVDLSNQTKEISQEKGKLETTNDRIHKKLEGFQKLYDNNQRSISLGNKVTELAESYFKNRKKKEITEEFMKLILVETTKMKAKSKKQRAAEKKQKVLASKEAHQKIAVIREEQKEKASTAAAIASKEAEKPRVPPKLNDRVRMFDGKAIGRVIKIEKDKAVVDYGQFTSRVALDLLEVVQPLNRVKK